MKDKTQYLHCTFKYATIAAHGREVGGGIGLVHDVFWREEKPWVVLKLPTGRRLTIPAALTDLPPKIFSTTEELAEFHAPLLLELAQFCHRLLPLQRRRRAMKKTLARPSSK
jgi:hypothetical protein